MSFLWNPVNLQHLREMWGKGLSAAKIAAAIGNPSRSSIIAKARRLCLDGRPSPIRRDGPAPERKPVRIHVSESGVKRSVGRPASQATALKPVPHEKITAKSEPRPTPRSVPITDGKPTPFNQLLSGQCKWISGSTIPGRADEAMACGAPIAGIGRPWCAHHVERAKGKAAAPTGNLANIETSAPRPRAA